LLLGEEGKPIIIRNAEKTFISYFPERLPASGVAYCLNKIQTEI